MSGVSSVRNACGRTLLGRPVLTGLPLGLFFAVRLLAGRFRRRSRRRSPEGSLPRRSHGRRLRDGRFLVVARFFAGRFLAGRFPAKPGIDDRIRPAARFFARFLAGRLLAGARFLVAGAVAAIRTLGRPGSAADPSASSRQGVGPDSDSRPTTRKGRGGSGGGEASAPSSGPLSCSTPRSPCSTATGSRPGW